MLFKAFIRKSVTFAYGRIRRLCKLWVIMFSITLTTFPATAQDTITIVAFGDSLTQGYGLPEGDGFVPQLQTWLDAQDAGVTLINAGVSGDTTAGGLARIAWTLDDSVDGVIVALGGNDLLRGIFPEGSRDNIDGILTVIDAQGLSAMLVGLPAPSNYGPEFKIEFDAMYPDLAFKHNAILYPFFFEGLGAGQSTADMLALMQADGTHPNAEGVKRIVAHMGPNVLELIARIKP